MTALFSQNVGKWVSLFIALISFGAASVVVLGGARIYYSMACDGVFFRGMKRVHPRWNTPVTSLLAQCVWVIVLILSGRYEQLYTCFVFMMTMTYVLTVGAVFVLRRTQPDRPRPYRCSGYPWLPLTYMVVACGFVLSTLLSRPASPSPASVWLCSASLYTFTGADRNAGVRQTPSRVSSPFLDFIAERAAISFLNEPHRSYAHRERCV